MWWRPDLFWEDSAQSDLGSLEAAGSRRGAR